MKMRFLVAMAGVLSAMSAFATAGDSYATAIQMGKQQTATLVEENDPVFGKMGTGSAWYSLTVQKGMSCTVWIQDGDVDSVTLFSWLDPTMTKSSWPMADFTWGTAPNTVQALFLYADSWDSSDPDKWTWYFQIMGSIGQKVNLFCTEGIHSFSASEGTENKPKSLTFKDSKLTASAKILELDSGYAYYYKAALKAGRKYSVKMAKGTTSHPLSLDMGGLPVESYGYDPANAAYWVYPEKDGTYTFSVRSDLVDQPFSMDYYSVPVRAVTAHPFIDLEESARTATFAPGRLIKGDEFYDDIVDEHLCRVKLAKGDRCVAETTGAEKPIRMLVYDSTGKVLASNESNGYGRDCLCAIEATAPGYYYIGVCNPALKSDEDPAGEPEITLTVRDAGDFIGDNYDPEDDVEAGANVLSPLPTDSPEKTGQAVDPTVVGAPCGTHVLNQGDWQDFYSLTVRKGTTYALKAKWDEADSTVGLTLSAEVYYYVKKSNKMVKTVVETVGNIYPGADVPLTFRADAATATAYYIRVFVKEGKGLSYPAHTMYAAAYLEGTEEQLGVLHVTTPGYKGATWSLDSEGVKYADGDSILVPEGNHTVKFTVYDSNRSFKAPSAQAVQIAAGTSPTECAGAYCDTYDPKDDVATAAVTVKPAATAASVKRTLWRAGEYGMADDPADWFAFTGTAGYFYNFSLADVEGDAVLSVLDKDFNPLPGCDRTAEPIQRLHTGAGKFYLKVEHAADGTVGGAYTLVHQCANVGALSFKSASVSVKKSAASVSLVVKRSAKDGVLRVNYATQGGTARPGEQYYPTTGTLVWKNGDKADKKITVKLIPELVATYTENRDFSVVLTPVDEGDLEDGEYLAKFSGTNEAKVTITQATKAVPGTVAVSAYTTGEGVVTTAVANVKKPAASVRAGDPLTLIVTRANGTYGTKVAVQLTTANGKAVSGTDFEPMNETLEWEAEDDSPRTVTIQTKDAGFYATSKAFSVKLKALTTGAYKGWSKPTISGTSVAVTLASPSVEMMLADYAKAAKTDGLTLKGTGTWIRNSNGALVCAPVADKSKAKNELTWTVSGPGVFTVWPETSGESANLTYAVGKGAATTWTEGPVRLMLGKGSQAVKFTLTGAGSTASFKVNAAGNNYEWLRFAAAVPDPVNKAVVRETREKLSWAYPAGLDATDLCVRAKFGTNSKKLNDIVWSGRATEFQMPAIEEGKTYYWTLEYALCGDAEPDYGTLAWTASGTTWQFGVSNVESSPATGTTGTDIWGDPIVEGDVAILMQGVYAELPLVTTNEVKGTAAALVTGKLPDGLKLDTKKMVVSGVPTKSGTYKAVLQLKNGKTAGETLALTFNVLPMGSAAGSFAGVMVAEDGALTNGLPAAASISFSSATKGTLSATVSLAGKSYKFSSSKGFTEVLPIEILGSPLSSRVKVTLVNKTTVNKVAYENLLTVTLNDGPTSDLGVLGLVGGTAELVMNVPDPNGKGVQPEVVYTGDLLRNNSSLSAYTGALAKFVGYYTVSLVPFAAEPGVPEGNGYLTLTVDAKGKVKVAGKLADGTSVSYSPVGALLGDLRNPESCVFSVPVFAAKSPYCFAGTLKISYADDENGSPASCADFDETLIWNKDGAQTYDGEGFRLSLQPVGGWYNKLYNLQSYYLGYEFAIQTGDYTQYEEPLSANYWYSTAVADGLAVSLSGNSFSVAKRSLVKDTDNKKLYDLAASVNPANVTFKFTRATGLVSGTFSAWTETTGAQKEIKSLKHYGVMTLARAEDSPLDDSVVTAGFFLMPMKIGKRSWNASLPFNLVGEFLDPDWSEPEILAPEGEE